MLIAFSTKKEREILGFNHFGETGQLRVFVIGGFV